MVINLINNEAIKTVCSKSRTFKQKYMTDEAFDFSKNGLGFTAKSKASRLTNLCRRIIKQFGTWSQRK